MKRIILNIKNNHSIIVLLISFLALLFSFLLAVYLNRPLLNEGSIWYYRILGVGETSIDPNFSRYLDVVINQLPALIIAKLFGASASEFNVRLLSFSYTMYPLFSLLLCYLYLKSKNRLDLLIFSILSLLFAVLPTLPLSMGLAALAVSAFWPVFYVIILRESKNKKEYFYILIGLVSLLFSYEPAVLLFAIIMIVSIIRLLKLKSLKNFDTFVILFSFFSICYLTYIIKNTRGDILYNHWIYIFSSIDTYRIYGFISILTFMGLFFTQHWKLKKLSQFFIIAFALTQIWFLYVIYVLCVKRGYINDLFVITQNAHAQSYYFGPNSAFSARATAIPLTFGIAVFALIWNYINSTTNFNFFFKNKLISYSLAIMVFIGASADTLTSSLWARGYFYYTDYILSRKGCNLMPVEIYNKYLHESAIQQISLQTLSVFIQILSDKKEVDTLVFLDESHLSTDPSQKDICATKNKSVYYLSWGLFNINTKLINFSETIR